jgi:hypothetical protein
MIHKKEKAFMMGDYTKWSIIISMGLVISLPFVLIVDMFKNIYFEKCYFKFKVYLKYVFILIGIMILNNSILQNLYETKMMKKLADKVKVVLTNSGLLLFFFISIGVSVYFMFGVKEIKVKMNVLSHNKFQLSASNFILKPSNFEVYLSIPSDLFFSIFSLLIFGSYYVFAVFGSAGFCFLGAELLKKYYFRPSQLSPEDLVLCKICLQERSEAIIEKSRMIYSINDDLKHNRHKMTKIEVDNKFTIMKKKMREIEKEKKDLKGMLSIYERQNNFDQENPLIYVVYAIAGCFVYFLGIIFAINNFYYLNDNIIFSDYTFYYLRTYAGMGVLYMLIIIVCFIIMWSIYKGRQNIAELVPEAILRNYNIEEDKTWSDDLLALSNFFLICSVGSMITITRQFPGALSEAGTYNIVNLNGVTIYPYSSFIYSSYVNATYLIFFAVGFFIVFFEPTPKEMLDMIVEEKKEDLKEKQEFLKENPNIV